MLDILKQRFDCEELEARLAPSSGGAEDGLQVIAEHSTGDSEDDIKFTVRCGRADLLHCSRMGVRGTAW